MLLALRRFIASLLIVSLAGIGLPLPVHAGMLPTDSVVAGGERERVVSLLERAEVRARLEAYGVSTADVRARVAALSDEEVAQLAANIEAAPAGGDVVGAIVLVFIVLLITDILGFTKIFPFTRSVR